MQHVINLMYLNHLKNLIIIWKCKRDPHFYKMNFSKFKRRCMFIWNTSIYRGYSLSSLLHTYNSCRFLFLSCCGIFFSFPCKTFLNINFVFKKNPSDLLKYSRFKHTLQGKIMTELLFL